MFQKVEIKLEPSDSESNVTKEFSDVPKTELKVTTVIDSPNFEVSKREPAESINYNSSPGGSQSSQTSSKSINKSPLSSMSADQIILEKINSLKMAGMLSTKRLPKMQEPGRPRTHWDYLLRLLTFAKLD